MQDDGDVIRALFAAFARRDADAAITLVDEDFEFWPQGTAKRVQTPLPYRGHDGVRLYMQHVAEVWADLEVEARSIRFVTGGCAAFGVARGTPIDGPPMEVPVIWVFRLRAGRVLHAKVVATAEEALAEASGEAAARRSST